MSHMLPDVSAPRCRRPLAYLRQSGRAFDYYLAPVVCAAAQTDGRRAQILFSSRWIMAVGAIAISPDALSTNAYALRMNATLGHLSMVRPTDCRCASTREFHCLR